MKRLLQLLAAGTMFAAVAPATAVFLFDSAGGALSGNPGTTVGWGFIIADATEFALVSETGFCPTGSTESDLPCANALGTYTDFTRNDPVVGPSPDSPSVTQPFNLGAQLGYGSFQISAGAAVGTVLNGEIAIVYDLFTGDPNTDPTATQIGGDNFISLPASVTVTGAANVPEPGTTLLSGLAISGVLLWSLRRRETTRKPGLTAG
jgi:PEP-CTERM motif